MPISPLLRQARNQGLRFVGEKFIFEGARFFSLLCSSNKNFKDTTKF